MATTVSYENLDALVGLRFDWTALASQSATLIDGSITTSSASTNEVLTYGGMIGTVGPAFFTMKDVTLSVASVNNADDSLVVDAYVGTSMVGALNFTVAGFSRAGIALAAMPLDALVSQRGDLPGLNGSLFVLGMNAAGANTQSVAFAITGHYTFLPGASVHYATAADPVLQGGKGVQMLIALSGDDTITAGPGKTIIYGGSGNDVLIGGSGINLIFGGSGHDTIYGGSGADTLTGGTGTDTIHAGTGRSVMVGGSGADTFVFAPGHTGGMTVGSADRIQHFHPAQGDRIDLTAFDALLPPGGTRHLTFIGTAAFDGHAGELRYDVTSTGVTVQGDLTGAGTADFLFTIKGPSSIVASDFLL